MPFDIYAWRKRTKISQTQAAEALGFTRQTIIALERKDYPVPRVTELACKYLEEHEDDELPIPRRFETPGTWRAQEGK